jgi:hypothetical protein
MVDWLNFYGPVVRQSIMVILEGILGQSSGEAERAKEEGSGEKILL